MIWAGVSAFVLFWVFFSILTSKLGMVWLFDLLAGCTCAFSTVAGGLDGDSILVRLINAVLTVFWFWSLKKNWPKRKKRFAAKLAGYKAQAIKAKMKAAMGNV